MSWNYRVVDHGSHVAVHEVYYREDGTICGKTDPVRLTGETVDAIAEDLELILANLRKHPVLVEPK